MLSRLLKFISYSFDKFSTLKGTIKGTQREGAMSKKKKKKKKVQIFQKTQLSTRLLGLPLNL